MSWDQLNIIIELWVVCALYRGIRCNMANSLPLLIYRDNFQLLIHLEKVGFQTICKREIAMYALPWGQEQWTLFVKQRDALICGKEISNKFKYLLNIL